MIKLWVYTDKSCHYFDLNCAKSFSKYFFEKRRNGVCIVWNQSKKILRYGESCILGEVLFYLEEIESTMCHFPISKKIKVGRSEACDIQLCTNGVSRYHFQIEEGVLQDFDSLNGTYVNSKRVKRCSLCMQDEIVFANIRMIYFKNYVLLDMVNNPYSNVELDCKNAVYYPSCLNVEMPKVQKFDIQMPQIMRTVQKQSLFSAIGPSCMIASSGFISSILIGYLQKQRIESLFTSMISSLTMAFTFMVYGLYNRNYQYKLSVKESTKSIDMYNAYIEKMYEKGVISKGTFKKQMDEYITKYIDTYQHENRDVIYVGCAYNAWCKISYREVSYEYALDELMQKREQLISNLNQFVQVPIFLRHGEVCWIQGDVKASIILFENYLWYSKQKRKWVWLQKFDGMKQILLNPYCAICEKIDADTIVVDVEGKYLPKSYYCLIYVGNQKPSFHYDYQIETIAITELSLDRKRFVLRNEDSNFYDQLIKIGPVRKSEYVMKVPVGIDESQQIVVMDFQEYGPHGLVAGMTGFGKSEFISFLLMMLIWHNTPQQFQYVLIDFKGGAFGQPFYEFAHCAGIVTNLDAQSMERFFQSMNYELEKRQRLFLKEKVSDIHSYNKIHTMSHLWIFVDEFAQLKMRFPQFMSQLQEIARIGRSLGIHLVLSTQKPSGIIDDQVWSNTTWRACFHVSSIQDSREMLQNEMAYHLKNPGDMILQHQQKNQSCRSFYLQSSIDEICWREINEKKEVLHSKHHAGKRVMDVLKDQIHDLKEVREWVLLPKDIPEHVFGVLDLPFEQKQCEIEFMSIQLFYTKSLDIVYRLIKYFENETIYVYGTNMLDSYVDFSFFQSRYFSKIHEGVCIIFEDENLDLSELDERVISFVVTNNENTIFKWILNKYVFDIESLDDKRIFFDTYHLPSYLNMTLYHNTYVEILYRKIKETDLKSRATKSMIFNKDKNCIGFECKGDRPVFMDETKKLFILYMHKDYVYEVNRICESLAHLKITSDWHQESDVYVVCVDVSLLNEDAFQKKLYNAQIVWVGYGLKEYGYMLKRKLPYEHFDCVFFKDQNEGVGICE